MKGINKTILVGTVGNDPEIKTFPNGGKLALFSIATNESWTDKNTGERKQSTEWHRIRASDGKADIIEKYVRKGMKLYIEGPLKTRTWTDQNGADRYVTEIHCQTIQMLDDRKPDNQPRQNQAPQNNGGYNQQSRQPDPSLDDDLPF